MSACGAVHPSGVPCHLPPHDEADGHRSDIVGQRTRWWAVDDVSESAPKNTRCPAVWGLFDKVPCRRKDGHRGLHSGRSNVGRIVW